MPKTDADMLSCKFDANLCDWYTKSVEGGSTFVLVQPKINGSLGPSVDFNTGSTQGVLSVFTDPICQLFTPIIIIR